MVPNARLRPRLWDRTSGGRRKAGPPAPQPDVQQTPEVLDETITASRANEQLGAIRDLFGRNDQIQEAVDLNNIARRALRLLAGELRSHYINAREELSPTPPIAYGHSSQLQQVLANLLLNAIEALAKVPDGTRTLTIKTKTDDSMAVIEVDDSGPGISLTDSGRVFDPFVTTKSQGMGLVLAICRTIVDRHGGKAYYPAGSSAALSSDYYCPRLDRTPCNAPGDRPTAACLFWTKLHECRVRQLKLAA